MKKKCSVVIGSSGFIGSNLLSKFCNSEDLFTISRSESSRRNHYRLDIYNQNKFEENLEFFIKNYKKIEIFYLAGQSSVELSLKNPKNAFTDSVNSFLLLLEKMKDKDCKIVFASSGAVYDSRLEDYFDEEGPTFPPSPYAAAKHACEGLAMAYYETFSLDTRIARIFSVFGPDMSRFFIYDFIEKISKEEKSIQLFGTGKQVRDYLHIDDVCNGLVTIMENGNAGEIYNLSSGKPTPLTELSDRIMEILQIDDIKISWDATQAVGTRDRWYGDNSKIKEIGFREKEKFDDQLQSTVREIYSKFN